MCKLCSCLLPVPKVMQDHFWGLQAQKVEPEPKIEPEPKVEPKSKVEPELKVKVSQSPQSNSNLLPSLGLQVNLKPIDDIIADISKKIDSEPIGSKFFQEQCQKLDNLKKAELSKLNLKKDINAAAQQLLTRVEVMHGKKGQTQCKTEIVKILLENPEIKKILQRFNNKFTDAAIFKAIQYLGLGEIEPPVSIYRTDTTKSDIVVLAIFSQTAERAVAIMKKFPIATEEDLAFMASFCSSGKIMKTIASQLVCLGDSIGRMATNTRYRPALSPKEIADKIGRLCEKDGFTVDLVKIVACIVLKNFSVVNLSSTALESISLK